MRQAVLEVGKGFEVATPALTPETLGDGAAGDAHRLHRGASLGAFFDLVFSLRASFGDRHVGLPGTVFV